MKENAEEYFRRKNMAAFAKSVREQQIGVLEQLLGRVVFRRRRRR